MTNSGSHRSFTAVVPNAVVLQAYYGVHINSADPEFFQSHHKEGRNFCDHHLEQGVVECQTFQQPTNEFDLFGQSRRLTKVATVQFVSLSMSRKL
jgi:hypothetical protein